MTGNVSQPAGASGPVLFAYDGTELAALAIAEAGELLSTERAALVLCVWQPFDVGFRPVGGEQFDAKQAPEIKEAAQRAAATGAELAEAAGFRAESLAIEASPTWKGIIDVADERDASVIVIGSHGRSSGLAGVFIGSVAAAVSGHSPRTVLITHRRVTRADAP
jgi:nucleotide-binding universal stress UspA family protein